MTATTPDPETTAARIETLLVDVATSADPRGTAEELVRQLMHLYGAGLARLMEVAYDHDPAAATAWFDRLAADPLVSSLLVLHGLHPDTLEQRVIRTLDRVQPLIVELGAVVQLLAVERDAVRLRVEARGNSAPSVSRIRPLIERVLAEATPEVHRVDFEGSVASPPLLQITRADGTPIASRPAIDPSGGLERKQHRPGA
jgi:hypothetical protein